MAPALAGATGRLDTGIQDPLDPNFGETDPGSVFGVVRSQGARVVRVPVSWASLASERPAVASDPEDPAYDWGWLDKRVAAIGEAGLKPLLVLYNPPVWAREVDNGKRVLAPVPADFAAFATAAARRYDGTVPLLPRVRYWQLINEPNHRSYFVLASGAQRYRAAVNAAYDALHAVAADSIVVAGGLSPFGNRDTIPPMRFMRGMLCMSFAADPQPTCEQRSSFDVWAIHPYTSGGPRHRAASFDDVSLGDLPKVRTFVRAAQRAGHIHSRGRVRFWVTEFGWDTNPPDPFAVRVRLHARWVAEALFRMWRNDVTLAVWFQLRDIESGRTDWGNLGQAGLFYRTADLYADERPKPAARAFRFPFVAVPGPRRVTVWGRTPDSRRHTVAVERRVRGRWVRVTRVRSNANGIFQTKRGGLAGQVLRARFGRSYSLAYRAVRSRDVAVRPFGGAPAGR
jgi:hypothetical protein